MSAVDTLKTILLLEQQVSGPAMIAAEAVEDLGEEAAQTERKVESLSDELVEAAAASKVMSAAVDDLGDNIAQTAASAVIFGNSTNGVAASAGVAGQAAGAFGGVVKGVLTTAVMGATAVLTGSGGGMLGALVKIPFAIAGASFSIGMLSQMLGVLARAVEAIAPIAAQGFGIALAFPILDRLKEYDSTKRVFSSVLGSAGGAGQMTGFLEQYGLESQFGQKPLTEVSKTLLLGGQDVNRFLPVAETIGLFGGGTDEAMTEVSSVLRRLMGGQIADALGPEGLGRFGINKEMLEGAGATFNKQGQFQGGVQEALQVLETLTQTHQAMKNIRQEMQGSIASVTSNFFDAINKNVRLFSEEVASKAIPMIKQLTDGFINLANSGIPEHLGRMFNEVFGINSDMKGSFDQIAAGFLALIETGLQMARNGFTFVVNAMKGFDPFLDKVRNALLQLNNPVATSAAVGLDYARTAFRMAGDFAKNALVGSGANEANFQGNYDKYYAMLTNARKKGPGEKILAPGSDGTNQLKEQQDRLAQEQNENLIAIRENTRIMAEAQIQRIILGGGQRGSLGVTAFDRSVMQGRSTGSPVERAVRDLVSAITEDTSLRLSGYDNMIRGRA